MSFLKLTVEGLKLWLNGVMVGYPLWIAQSVRMSILSMALHCVFSVIPVPENVKTVAKWGVLIAYAVDSGMTLGRFACAVLIGCYIIPNAITVCVACTLFVALFLGSKVVEMFMGGASSKSAKQQQQKGEFSRSSEFEAKQRKVPGFVDYLFSKGPGSSDSAKGKEGDFEYPESVFGNKFSAWKY